MVFQKSILRNQLLFIRMTQSMYVIGRSSQQSFRSDSQSSGVSFFVDFGDSKENAGTTQNRSKS